MSRSPPTRFSPQRDPLPPKIYKDYFDDPTLSDLTIRLSDRCVHVHRIVLCRNSEYFNKLILTGFKESDQKEIELHDDDPSAMVLLLRYIYDLPYDDLIKNEETSMSFLAKVYVAADKYQIERVKLETHYQIRKHKLCKEMTDIDDFLDALETIADGTAPQSAGARRTRRLHQVDRTSASGRQLHGTSATPRRYRRRAHRSQQSRLHGPRHVVLPRVSTCWG